MQNQEVIREIHKMISQRMAEQEQTFKNMALRGELQGSSEAGPDDLIGGRSKELKAKREKILMEYLDVQINNAKHELTNIISEEKSRKNFRLKELQSLIDHNKEMAN
mmetsp:Transcript_21450/g.33137  ORF Transcript_21450/g.33137 Transcript_21450/m.33137 type:complete len:107 (-) Transcript_21450:1869-2189(-)